MPEVVIVEAVRCPVGRRHRGPATIHPVGLLTSLHQAVVARAGDGLSTGTLIER